jgi:hypothetical protein
MTRITSTTIATTTPLIPPAIGSMLLVWGYGGEHCSTTILLDKDDKNYHQHYNNYYTTNTSYYRTNVTMVEGVVLLLFYLIKMIMITTNTIATTTPTVHPAIGPILFLWCSNVLLLSYLIKKSILSPVWGSSGEDCTTTILPDKDDYDYYQHYSHYYTDSTSSYRTNIISLML